MRPWLNLWCCEGQPNQFLKMGVTEKTVSVSQWSNKSLSSYYLSILISITYSNAIFPPPYLSFALFYRPIIVHFWSSPPLHYLLPWVLFLLLSWGFLDLSPLRFFSESLTLYPPFPHVASRTQCYKPEWKCCVCVPTRTVCPFECLPANVQLCVCA